MTTERATAILIDAPVSLIFSTPDEIRAWLKELDDIESEVVPNSDATDTIATVRERALYYLDLAEKRTP